MEGRVDEDPRLRGKTPLGLQLHADTKHNQAHFIDEEVKAQRGEAISPGSHSL